MKKVFIVLSSVAFLIGCGNNTANNNGTGSDKTGTNASGTNSEQSQEAAASDADAERGLTLIAQSDCLGCHKVEEKLTGPAYMEVAQRYPKNDATIDSLSNKIIHGGAGNWGPVAMTPHPTLSKEDAQAMVKYILSLKK
ncbi:MAG: c-type cytochrome [Flavisolibacter sp.]|nr:c-type cytochrome [Flavisolibacter sp.]